MSSFLSTLCLVLNDEEIIEDLPNNELRASDAQGVPVQFKLSAEDSRKLFLKIARLQTLMAKVSEETEMPSYDTSVAINEGQHPGLEETAKAMAVSQDGLRRIAMLRQLIVEIVREAVSGRVRSV